MSLFEETVTDTGARVGGSYDPGIEATSNFRFVPHELAVKSRKLIESFHAIHGYGCLPDLLWNSGARDVIECNRELAQIFKSAAKSRRAKRAKDSLVLIATAIFSVEMLARDVGGWGKRFPLAKRKADGMLVDVPLRQRTWFMDSYLYPSQAFPRDIFVFFDRSVPAHAAIRN